jgi:hypothetical protein
MFAKMKFVHIGSFCDYIIFLPPAGVLAGDTCRILYQILEILPPKTLINLV